MGFGETLVSLLRKEKKMTTKERRFGREACCATCPNKMKTLCEMCGQCNYLDPMTGPGTEGANPVGHPANYFGEED